MTATARAALLNCDRGFSGCMGAYAAIGVRLAQGTGTKYSVHVGAADVAHSMAICNFALRIDPSYLQSSIDPSGPSNSMGNAASRSSTAESTSALGHLTFVRPWAGLGGEQAPNANSMKNDGCLWVTGGTYTSRHWRSDR